MASKKVRAGGDPAASPSPKVSPRRAKRPAPKPASAAATRLFVVLHPVSHSGVEYGPGDEIAFQPWAKDVLFVDGAARPVMSTDEDVEAAITTLIEAGVIAPRGQHEAALARADAARARAAATRP